VSRPVIDESLLQAIDDIALRLGTERDALINHVLGIYVRLAGGGVDAQPEPEPEPEPEPIPEPPRPVRPPQGGGKRAPPRAEPPPLSITYNGHTVSVELDQDGRFTIGRGNTCAFVVQSAKVSREHAAITNDGRSWVIEDLGSSNGMFSDGRKVQRVVIDRDMDLQLGTETITLTLG
jgi:pSer/pThr/pTyr-binding forkhead associated (FHA) protein